jgi:hypothetical protein
LDEESAAAAADCPNKPVDDGGGDAKENGVAGVLLHRAAQIGHVALPETQRRWNVWAHSDVKIACQRPMSPRQASHWPPLFLAMIVNDTCLSCSILMMISRCSVLPSRSRAYL